MRALLNRLDKLEARRPGASYAHLSDDDLDEMIVRVAEREPEEAAEAVSNVMAWSPKRSAAWVADVLAGRA